MEVKTLNNIRSSGVFMMLFVVAALVGLGVYSIRRASIENNLVKPLDEEPRISLYIHETGEVKELSIEEYIKGVVAGEMKPDWPKDAYAAQAILARTFTMEKLSRGGTRAIHGTDMCDFVEHAQAYNPDAITPTISQAVESTRGEVATWKNRYIKAWFHAYSGGRTESARVGLNFKEKEPPYIKIVKSPGENYAPAEIESWIAEFTSDEIRNGLANSGINVGDIRDIKIAKKSTTGRASVIRVIHSQGSTNIPAAEFRLAIGANRLISTWLTSSPIVEDGRIIFKGTGYGHGVGMDQWGAYALAKEGKGPEEIVEYFFKGISIKKMWD